MMLTVVRTSTLYRLREERDRAVSDARLARRAEREARYTAQHDGLTGLLNRGGLTARWPGRPTGGLILVDLDDLKIINDTYGHEAGDTVLKMVAGRLADTPGTSLATRLGGDEFAAIVGPPAYGTACRIGQIISQPIDLPDGQQVTVTASTGLVQVVPDDLSTALRCADQAMYVAKNRREHVSLLHCWTPRDSTVVTARFRKRAS